MKKVGVLLSEEPYGGGAFQYNQSILEALVALPQDKFEIYAYYTNPSWETYLERFKFVTIKINTDNRKNNFLSAATRKVLRLIGILEYHFVGLFAKIDNFIRNFEEMDLMIFPAQEGYAGIRGKKSISVIHDLMHRYETFPEVCANGIFADREFRYKTMCEASEIIFVDSEVGRNQVVECYGGKFSDKLRVLPFTPPQYLFEEKDDVASEIKNALPEKFVFYPAQFWEHKNHKNLILAVRKLKDNGIDVKMVFVGSKKNGYESAMSLIKDLDLADNISVLGYVDDDSMRYLYKHARAMIMASKMGPTNIPPLEGMATGCPVAVANVYAMPWQVGDAGILFDPYSVESMAEAIKQLWLDDELCQVLRSRGFEQIKNFTQDKFNKRFMKYIEEALAV